MQKIQRQSDTVLPSRSLQCNGDIQSSNSNGSVGWVNIGAEATGEKQLQLGPGKSGSFCREGSIWSQTLKREELARLTMSEKCTDGKRERCTFRQPFCSVYIQPLQGFLNYSTFHSLHFTGVFSSAGVYECFWSALKLVYTQGNTNGNKAEYATFLMKCWVFQVTMMKNIHLFALPS